MLGVCYYPEHWPEAWWAEDARRMRELGVSFVRIGEFAWVRLEPRRGEFHWGWLDRAIDTLGAAGLKVVLGTPTATPPKWLMDAHPEIAPVDIEGRPRGFGSRRHYSFSSDVYRRESARIVEAIARRYGAHAALAGWQIDNEYGCHSTVLSWGLEDAARFRDWLRRRYQTPEALNAAWGSVFWSMDVQDFAEVSLPHLTVTEPNPAARLDFRRFASEQVRSYNELQSEIIRRHSPGRWVTHNFMGFFTEFDHFEVGESLDFASWDSYPIGFLERSLFSEAERLKWQETSHPDIAPFHHDLYRRAGHGKFWVMEQQPGPVNWAPHNPIPAPGTVKLWTIEAHAHGAEVVSYFRWRQAPFAQEQMHAGLNLPNSHELSAGGREAMEAARDLEALGELPASARAPVAIVFDYEAVWVTEIQPQGQTFNALELVFRFYEAARRLGLNVDFVRPGDSLEDYLLVLAPSLPIVSETAEAPFAAARGLVAFGPRAGSKTRSFSIPDGLPPGPLRSFLPMRVLEVASMRPGVAKPLTGEIAGAAVRWLEHIETSASVLARFGDGWPALMAEGRYHYLGFWPDEEALASLMRGLAAKAGLPVIELPEGVRLRRRGDLLFAFNYGAEAWRAAIDTLPIIGSDIVQPQDYAVWRC